MAGATAVARGTDERARVHRRQVAATRDRLEHVVLYEVVPAGEAVLVLDPRRAQRPGSETVRTYEATLRFPGLLGPRQAVELDVAHDGGLDATFVLRRVGGLARRLSAERFDRAAVAALAALDHLLPWQEVVDASLSLELAHELLEQSGAVAVATTDELDRELDALVIGGGEMSEAARVA